MNSGQPTNQTNNNSALTKSVVHNFIKTNINMPLPKSQFPYIQYEPLSAGNHHQPLINTRIHKLTDYYLKQKNTKQESRYKQSKQQILQTQSIQKTNNNKSDSHLSRNKSRNFELNNQKRQKRMKDKSQLSLIEKVRKMESQSIKTHKHLEKIMKIKQYKMKQYLKNNFAISTKTIETQRYPDHGHPKKLFQKSLNQNVPHQLHHQPQSNQVLNLNIFRRSRQIRNPKQKNSEIWKNYIIKDARKSFKTSKHQKTHQKRQQSNFKFNVSESEDHPAELRLKKIIKILNQILNTYHISFGYDEESFLSPYHRHLPKLKYYVGPGNNRNLIISLMKKRWWWSQAKNIEDSHFVWTQNRNPQTTDLILNVKQEKKTLKLITQKTKKRVVTQPTKIQSQSSDIDDKQFCIMQPPKLIHNHYPSNQLLGNKKWLYLNMKFYCSQKDDNIKKYLPETHYIEEGDKQALQNFEERYKKLVSKKCLWVIKPGENSNRGCGIQITKYMNKVKQRFGKLNTNESLIIQKYIENPLLYNKRKFDIRTFMAAVTIGSRTKFFWYNQGYIRTSSQSFTLKDYEDIYIHLTNDAIQMESQNYGKHENGNKVSYKDFDKYLKSLNLSEKISMNSINKQMQNIAAVAVKSCGFLINTNIQSADHPQNQKSYAFGFEVFGLDYMLDQNLKLYLIQINTNPSLETACPLLERIIPQMLDNMLKISIDPIMQPNMQNPRSMSNLVPEDFLKSNNFSLMLDSNVDKDITYRQNLYSQIKNDRRNS